MRKKIRLYKNEYDTLPRENKEFLRVNEDGQEILEKGLKIGKKEYQLKDIEIVEKGTASARSGARHIAVCRNCNKLNIMYANGLCAACYQRLNFKKNHPEIAMQRELNVQERKDTAKEKERLLDVKAKLSKYPYNILLDTFGETAYEMFGNELEKVKDKHINVINNLIDTLSDKYKKAATRYYKGYESFRQIANDSGCTASWISNMVGRFRDTVEANREAIESGDIDKIVYLRRMYDIKPGAKYVTWATIKKKMKERDYTDKGDLEADRLKDMFSAKTYRCLRKAGIYSLDELKESLKARDNKIQKVKGTGLDIMSEVLVAVYSSMYLEE